MKYLDTSAFVKHYRKEERGSDIINKLVDDAKEKNGQLISSFVVVGETVSVFDKWARYKFITKQECDELVRIFLKEIKQLTDNEVLILESVSSSTITLSVDLITKHHLSLNDAMHLYTALSNKNIIQEFICSDDSLLKAAKSEGFEVLNPEG